MFAAAVVSLFALSTFAPSVAAIPSVGLSHRNVHRAVPAQFQEERRDYVKDSNLLEPYETYAERYREFGCQNIHNTSYWDQCCHPLLKDESVDELPESCCDLPLQPSSSSLPPHTSTRTHHRNPVSTSTPHTTEKHETETPTTTSTPPPPKTTEQPTTTKPHTSPAPTTSKASGGGGGGGGGDWVSGGFATYFYQEGNAGACGDKHSDNDLIAAIDYRRYGPANKKSDLCGKKVLVVNKNNGKSATILIADDCPSCQNANCLDLSVGAFKALDSDLNDGEFPIEYKFLD